MTNEFGHLVDVSIALRGEAESIRQLYHSEGEDWHRSPLTSNDSVSIAKAQHDNLLYSAATVDAAIDVLRDMHEAWAYFSEYCVPIGIKERIDALIGAKS